MRVKASMDNLTVVEFRNEKDILDGFHSDLYEFGQEVLLKLLIHPDHIEMHSALISEDADYRGRLITKKHVRNFYYLDMIAMNETMKRIHDSILR